MVIKNGDALVLGTSYYTIRRAETWHLNFLGQSFTSLATETGSVKRASLDANGHRTYEDVLASVTALPLQPLDSATKDRMPMIQSPHTVKQTMIRGSSDDEVILLIVDIPETDT